MSIRVEGHLYYHNHHHQPSIPFKNRVWMRKGNEQFIPVLPIKRVPVECGQIYPQKCEPILKENVPEQLQF